MNQHEYEKTEEGDVLIRDLNKKKVLVSYQKILEQTLKKQQIDANDSSMVK